MSSGLGRRAGQPRPADDTIEEERELLAQGGLVPGVVDLLVGE